MALEKRHPSPPAVLADLLGGLDFTSDRPPNLLIPKRAAERAPRSAYAQVNLAMDTGLALSDIPRQDRPRAIAEALQAADRAMKLAPEFGDVHAAWCMLHSETRIAECEDRLRAGKRIDPGAPFVDAFLSGTLRQAGRLEEAFELTRTNYARDPYVPTKIGYVLQAYEFDDQSKEAEELFVKAVRWWPEFEGSFFMNRAFGKMHRADFEGVATLLRRARKDVLPPYAAGLIDVVAVASAKSISASSVCGNDVKPFIAAHCAIVLAWLGDHDRAFAFADRAYPKRIGSTPAETERIWLNHPDSMPTSWLSTPAAAPLRRDPRFLALAQRLGLLAYWRTGRLPDFCRKQREPICARLSRA